MKKRITRVLIGIFIVAGVGVAGLLIWARTAPRPHLGVSLSGELTELPDSPNAVSTQTDDAARRMDPLPYKGDRAQTRAALLDLLGSLPEATVVADRPDLNGYIRAEFRTPLIGFIDDVEFVCHDRARVVHFRSASRRGHSDLGANRKRMQRIHDLWAAR